MKNICYFLLLLTFPLHAEALLESNLDRNKPLRTAIQELADKGAKELVLYSHPLVDADLEGIGTLKGIELLWLRGSRGYGSNRIGDEGLLHISKSTSIKCLKIGALEFTDAGLKHLAAMTQLEELEIDSNDSITGEGLAHLKNLTQLKRLDLFHCPKLTGDDLQYLKGMKKLEHLQIQYIKNLTDASLAHLSGLTALKEIHWDDGESEISDVRLAHLKDLHELTWLEVKRMKNVTDQGLLGLRNHPKLEYLVLDGLPKVTDAGLAVLEQLPKLTYLELVELRIGDTGLKSLRHLQNLKGTLLWSLSVTPDGLKVLSELAALESVRTNRELSRETLEALAGHTPFRKIWVQFDDEMLKILSRLPNLDAVYLDDKATDVSLELISGMKSVKSVVLGYHPKVSAQGLAKFKAARPDCAVTDPNSKEQ